MSEEIHLTPREKEVLLLLVRGHTRKEICIKMGIQLKTVEKFNTILHYKLNVGHRIALIRVAIKKNLIHLDAFLKSTNGENYKHQPPRC